MKIRFTESPVIILGTGIHKQNYAAPNSLNDWFILLKLIVNEKNLKDIEICESKYKDPTLLWEEIVTAYQNSSNQLRSLASHEAEYLLKKEVVSILTKRTFIKDKNYTIDKFRPSCIISLNFDTRWANGNIKRTRKYIPDRKSDSCLTKSQITQLYLRVWYQHNKKGFQCISLTVAFLTIDLFGLVIEILVCNLKVYNKHLIIIKNGNEP